MNKDFAKGLGIGITAGAIIGGIMALLYAPKSGEDTRDLIKEKAIRIVRAIKH
jgi:gas vesicle protein